MTYRTLLRDPRWQRRRLEILQRDQWTCQQCGETRRELHVHHRWYEHSAYPWEVPEQALTTVCAVCHASAHQQQRGEQEQPMAIVNDTETRVVTVFSMPDGEQYHLQHISGTDYFYLRQDELIRGIAMSLRKAPEDLWEDYLAKGGERFRDGLFASHGPERVMYTDIRGYVWLYMEWAMDCCNTYNPTLKNTILTYYRRNAMGLRGDDAPTPGTPMLAVVSENLAKLAMFTTACLQEVYGKVDDLVVAQQHHKQETELFQADTVRHIARNDRQLEQLSQEITDIKRVYTQWERTIRGFVETFCGSEPSLEETSIWGKEMTKRYRHHMPLGKFPQTPYVYGGKPVNYYEAWMLIEYFTEKGLYKAQPGG